MTTTSRTHRPPPELLRPERLRSIERERPFGWLPCCLLKGDLLWQMSNAAKALYLHQALAADRSGLSFWSDRRIHETIALCSADLEQARQQLIELDLLAFDGRTYQLLSLPQNPQHRPAEQPRGTAPSAEADSAPTQIPAAAREILRSILGRDFSG